MTFFDENETAELMLPPLQPEIAKLTFIHSVDTTDYQEKIKETKNILKKFEELFSFYMEKCETKLNPYEQPESELSTNFPRSLRFVYKKLSKLVFKHMNITREINAQIGATISVSSVFFRVLLENNIPGSFDFEGFDKYIKQIFRKNKDYQSLYKKIKILQAYVTRNSENKLKKVTFDDICSKIPEIDQSYSDTYSFTPFSFGLQVTTTLCCGYFFIKNSKAFTAILFLPAIAIIIVCSPIQNDSVHQSHTELLHLSFHNTLVY